MTPAGLVQDITQILWDMYQIMREDPRRRFVFGFTIENTQMRVWMANRSEVAVEDSYVGIPFPFQILLPIAQYSLHLPGLANILQPHSNDAHGY